MNLMSQPNAQFLVGYSISLQQCFRLLSRPAELRVCWRRLLDPDDAKRFCNGRSDRMYNRI